jgi:hypothetical protein
MTARSSLDICKGPRTLLKVLESRNLHVISQGAAPSKPESATPSFEEVSLRPVKKMSRYLKTGRSGGGQTVVATEWSDLS